MFFSSVKLSLLVIIISSFCSINTWAQQSNAHSISEPMKSTQITINQFDWAFDNTTNTSEVKITITNKSKRAIKSVTISLTGQNKDNVMLQSGGTHTIKRKTAAETILPNETRTLVFQRAFNNPQLDKLTLKEVNIEYENGSLEMLN